MEITSPLGTVRKKRHLTLEEAAARARLEVDDVKALEENRIYRFPSVDEALATTLVYATSLGVSEREARELAGMPVPTRARWNFKRWVVVATLSLVVATLFVFAVEPRPPPLPDRPDCRRSGGRHPRSFPRPGRSASTSTTEPGSRTPPPRSPTRSAARSPIASARSRTPSAPTISSHASTTRRAPPRSRSGSPASSVSG